MIDPSTIEKYGIIAVLLGLALLAVGWVWLVLRAFRVRLPKRWLSLLPPPVAPLYALAHARRTAGPLILLLLGLMLAASPYALNFAAPFFLDLGPRERVVDGATHLTLTGWDRKDYAAVFRARPNAAVLQMANSDVDDAVVSALAGMADLRELDLNGTRITDASLPVLAALPRLEVLRLRGTKITDAGYRRHLANKASLRELDLRQTAVDRAAVKAWREARPGRKALR